MVSVPVLVSACNLKVKYLPQIAFPYVSEVEFLKQIDPTAADLKKIPFEHNTIATSFYMYIKINNLENKGEIRVPFYGSVRIDAKTVLEYAEDYKRNELAKLFQYLPLPFYPVPGGMAVDNQPSEETRHVSIISAYYRGCFRTGLLGFLFPRTFNLDHFVVDFFEKKRELFFVFGEPEKYYEHIIFIDKMLDMEPGNYRYAVFLNERMLYENSLILHFSLKKN